MNYRLIGLPKNGVTLCQMINHYLQENKDLHYIAIVREPYERFWSAIKECTYAYKANKIPEDNKAKDKIPEDKIPEDKIPEDKIKDKAATK